MDCQHAIRRLTSCLVHPVCCAAPGTVQASSSGRVRLVTGKVTFGSPGVDGYRRVCLFWQGVYKTVLAHRLVAHAFLRHTSSSDHWQVNHVDGDKSNNRLNNLEYVTPSQNQLHRHSRCPGQVREARPVMARLLRSDQAWITYPSVAECARQHGLSITSIYNCCSQKIKHTKGYEFRYERTLALAGEVWRAAIDPGTGVALPREVSSLGRIKAMRGYPSYGTMTGSGYRSVCVTINGTQRHFLVHRLVLRTFSGPPPTSEHCDVNHRDRNPSNNSLDNLEYATRSENAKHSYATNPCRKFGGGGPRPILARAVGSDEWRHFSSITDAANTLALRTSNMSMCCRGQRRSSGSYEFQYAVSALQSLPGEEWRDVDLESFFTLRTA